MLAETTYRAGKRYRDDHHHPLVFDVLAAGNVGRPSFDRGWFSDFEEWIQGCKELVKSKVVRKLLDVASVREYEEDSTIVNFKTRRKSSCKKEYHEFKQRSRSTSDSSFIQESKEGTLDRCIKRTANMDLSTMVLANENSEWLAKEIRGVRKKLKQINNLLESETKNITLSSEQKAKIARRPTLETELSIYETAVEQVTKRIKELSIDQAPSTGDKDSEESAQWLEKSVGMKDSEPPYSKKDEDSSDSNPEKNDDKSFFCDVCGVKCSDKSSFILHQNGRKHRNKVAQLAELEKEKTAASIREKQQIEWMKSAPVFTSPPKKSPKSAWGTPSAQPNYKLPPPPHPVVAQVSLSPAQSMRKGTRTPTQKSISTAEKKKPFTKSPVGSPLLAKSLSPVASNFTAILPEQQNAKKALHGGMKESPPSLSRNSVSNANAIRTVPSSLYPATVGSLTPGPSQKSEGRSPSISLADFLTPQKKKPSSSPAVAPWMKSPSSKIDVTTSPTAKSIAQIQAEEETLRSKQDKSYGKGGGSWYVERRERAESVLEIQRSAQEDLEHRLMVEEQLKIEAQIQAENERRKKLEQEKTNKNRGAPKRKKKPQNGKKSNPSNARTPETAPNSGKNNRNNGKKKQSNKISKKPAGKSPRQLQKPSEKEMS